MCRLLPPSFREFMSHATRTKTTKPASIRPLRPLVDPNDKDEAQVQSQDATLVASLRAGHPNAPAHFFDVYGAYVERLLYRTVGRDPEIEDLLHEVFAAALSNISKLRNPHALKPWLTRITVITARRCIRRRSRGRWLRFMAHQDVPEQTCVPVAPDVRQRVDRVYELLSKLRADHRIPFVLHEFHQMTLPETAKACGVSLATVKRRIRIGKAAFMDAARQDPMLRGSVPAAAQEVTG